MEKLEPLTKEVFGVGLKEWRISVVFVDGSNSSFSVFRIVAPDPRDALRIFSAQIFGKESEEDFLDTFEEKGIDDLEDDSDNTYYIPSNWGGIPCEDENVALYEIDPFDGSLDLLINYKNKFQWGEKEE